MHALVCALLLLAGQSAQESYRLGIRLYGEGKLAQAELALKEALSADPSFAPAKFQLGAVYVGLGRLEDARKAFQAVLDRYPTAELEFRAGLSYFLAGYGNDARPHLERALELEPSHVEARLLLGQLEGRAKEYETALALFDAVCRDAPENAEAHYHRAVTLAVLGRMEKAQEAARRAAQLAPGNPRVHRVRGQVLLSLEQWSEAASELQQAVRLGSRGEGIFAELGRALFQLEQFDLAEDALRRALEQSSDDPATHYYLARVLLRQDREEEALSLLERAHELSQRPDTSLLDELANAYLRASRLEDAERTLRETLSHFPSDDRAHLQLGWVHYLRVDDAAAEREFAGALELRPSGEAHFYLGLAQEALGKLREAETSYRRATELAPELARAHLALGKRLVQRGLEEEGETSFRAALELEPDLAEAHLQVGLLAMRRAELDQAVRSFRSALAHDATYAPAWYNLSMAYTRLGREEEGREAKRRYDGLAVEASHLARRDRAASIR